MVPFFFIHLLLMALLLQHAEEKKEPRRQKPPGHDEAVHHQEFCLSIPEAPQSTGLDFETRQPTKSASKPKPIRKPPPSPKLAVQQPRQPVQPDVLGPPMSGEENYPSAGDPEIIQIFAAPIGLQSPDGPVKVSDGCYCKEQNKKPLTETYQVSHLNIHYPSETCRSTEYIEILKDGRNVCVTQFSLVAHFFRSLSKPVLERRSTESPEISSTTHQSTTAETSTSTHPAIGSDDSYDLNALHDLSLDDVGNHREMRIPVKDSGGIQIIQGFKVPDPADLLIGVPVIKEHCTRCIQRVTWNNFDLKDVQLVDLKLPSSNCPASISVSLTDGRHICMDSSHPEFQQLLAKLEIKEP